MKKYFPPFVIIALFFFLTGCVPTNENFISEGTMEYDVQVVDKNVPMASMLPSKMTLKFKTNKSCAEMSAGMGLFSSAFISDPEEKTLTVGITLLNKKFLVTQTEKELKEENKSFNYKLIPTNKSKVIAGYKCQKAIVHDLTGNCPDFDVFYTKDLNIKDPNFANPFYMVDGVLMEYQMKKFGFELKFTAKRVIKEKIDDSVFEAPDNYKKISSQEMNAIFMGFQ